MFTVNSTSSIPIYEQIINNVKEGLLKNLLVPGDKLPSVRELSKTLSINPNTVAKSYKELENLGLIEVIRGKGTFISKNYSPEPNTKEILALNKMLKQIVINAHYLKLDKNYLIQTINKIYDDFEKGDLND